MEESEYSIKQCHFHFSFHQHACDMIHSCALLREARAARPRTDGDAPCASDQSSARSRPASTAPTAAEKADAADAANTEAEAEAEAGER